MTKKFKMTAATLKKAGKELEEILVPTDDDKNPIKIAVEDKDEMKTLIIEAGKELTPEDEISANLTSVLAELGVSIKDAEETIEKGKENDSKEEKEDVLTWEDINSMNKKKLIELCEEKDLVTDSEDYDELKDFRTDVAIELEIEVPAELEEDTKEPEAKPKKKKVKENTPKDDENFLPEKPPETDENKDGNDDDEVDLGILVASTKKLAHLKEICEIHDDFKKLRKGLKKYKGLSGPRELKPKMLKLLGIEPEEVKPKVESNPETKPKKKESIKTTKPSKSEEKREEVQKAPEVKENKPKKTNKSKYNRVTSVSDSIQSLGKKGFTIQELQEVSDKLYAKKANKEEFDSGTKRMHPATHIVNYMVTGLITFCVLVKTDKTYKLK